VGTSLAAIGIVTADMAESVRFYRTLGLDVPDPEGDHHALRLPNGFMLMWDTVEMIRSFDPDWVQPVGHGMALAFECASPADVDAVFARVVDAGFRAKKEPWDAFWGQRYAQLYDPDGNAVDLFAALEQG
jgi:catechol 2,3-dioxygenase-like lactoylglutathione lyase family enzyme